jgi:CheY-like chemotaxis protein
MQIRGKSVPLPCSSRTISNGSVEGRAALEAARGAQSAFDLIITNNYMPGLSGAELIARVREDFPTLPILHVDDVARRGRIPPLPSDIPTIYKPFSIGALRAAVKDLLGSRN